MYPDELNNFILVLGLMHKKQNFTRVTGNYLERSGWEKAFQDLSVHLGWQDGFLNIQKEHVKAETES